MNRADKKRIEARLQERLSSPALDSKYAKAKEDVEEGEKVERKQLNFRLSESSEAMLDAICHRWEENRSSVLRRLIQEKYFELGVKKR